MSAEQALPNPEQGSESVKTDAMGHRVGRSMVWMLGTSVLIKALSFVAQVAMGWYLSDRDFGVFALAFAFVGLCSFIREGGARDYLIQQGPKRYHELVGPLFWMAMTLTVCVCVVLLGLAGLVKALPTLLPLEAGRESSAPWYYFSTYRDPRLPWLLALGVVLMLLNTPSSFTSAKLQIELRFDTLGKVQIGSGLIRYGTMIFLAAKGFGPFSFMIASIEVCLYELIVFGLVVKMNLFRQPARPHLWRGFMALTFWLAVGFFGNFLVEWGNSAAVGLFRPQAIVGYYYFAFGLTVQLVVLLSVNAQQVLMPALTRLNNEPERQGCAVSRVTQTLILVASGLCLGFSVVADSVLTIIWHGKWEPAVLAVQIFGIFFPMRMTYGLTLAVLQAKGQFRKWAITSMIEAVLLFAAAGLGAWYAPGAEWPTLFVGVALVFSRTAITAVVLKDGGVGVRERLKAQFPAWGLSLIAAAIAWGVDIYLVGLTRWQSLQGWLVGHAHLTGQAADRWGPVLMEFVRAAVLGSIFTLGYALLVRFVMPGVVADTIAHAPRKIRGLAARLAFINLQPPASAEQAAAETDMSNTARD
ncbi:MAG: oligosaccharide flippase family protein [Phycisphaerales bacterium]